MAKSILAWNEGAGQFYREIGKKPNGKPARVYLGADEKKVTANVFRLEAVWDAVEVRWKRWSAGGSTDAPSPFWDDVTLSLARAIGKGEWTVTVEPRKTPPSYRRVARLSPYRFPDDPGGGRKLPGRLDCSG